MKYVDGKINVIRILQEHKSITDCELTKFALLKSCFEQKKVARMCCDLLIPKLFFNLNTIFLPISIGNNPKTEKYRVSSITQYCTTRIKSIKVSGMVIGSLQNT